MFFHKANLQKIIDKYEEKKVGVARLKPTRYDISKGTRIGPSKRRSLNLVGFLFIQNQLLLNSSVIIDIK